MKAHKRRRPEAPASSYATAVPEFDCRLCRAERVMGLTSQRQC
jgi:hypothetical protein